MPNMGRQTSPTFIHNIAGIYWAKMFAWFGQGLSHRKGSARGKLECLSVHVGQARTGGHAQRGKTCLYKHFGGAKAISCYVNHQINGPAKPCKKSSFGGQCPLCSPACTYLTWECESTHLKVMNSFLRAIVQGIMEVQGHYWENIAPRERLESTSFLYSHATLSGIQVIFENRMPSSAKKYLATMSKIVDITL